jgi:hypothetical protein
MVVRRCGITTDPKRVEAEVERTLQNVRHWEIIGPFSSREDAAGWERLMRGFCDEPHGEADGADSGGAWFGYCFEHDGPDE